MATDSTNLPQGEANVDAGTDMTGSELDLTAVQLAQVEGAQPVQLPKGNQVILIPVKPGQVIELPTDTTDGLLAKIGPAPEGNLAIVVDGRTIILQGYVHANEESPVKIVTNDGDTVDVADVVAATDPSLDIQTAAGPATNPGDTNPDSSGIFVPFGPGDDLGGLHAAGILDPTALQYKLIDDERKLFDREEDASPDFDISFDILGGVINEDDLRADAPDFPQLDQRLSAKFILGGHSGSDGTGNDPFDGNDRDEGGATNGDGYPDSDREPLVTVATINVNFHGDVPGKLILDLSLLPAGLKSEGEDIVYELIPAGGGLGNGIIGFVDANHDGHFDETDGDREIFSVQVNEGASNGLFHVTFTLFDNLDNTAPDSLIGADEQVLGLPVHFKIVDSNGTTVFGTLPLGVEDDIPFFGQVDDCGVELKIIHTDVHITHDETPGVQPHSDDVSIFNPYVFFLGIELAGEVHDAGFKFPDDAGKTLGAAKSQVHVSFGADGPAVFVDDSTPNTAIRNSVFGALQDKADGTVDDKVGGGVGAENEHPFELFMVKDGTVGKPTSDSQLTIDDQLTNATVTWDGDAEHPLPVYLHQIDAHTVIGYVLPDGPEGDKVAVFALNIDDSGCLTFFQIHQLNHDVDGPTFSDHDDPFSITDPDGNPLIYVRATDFDGDHAIQKVNLVVEDDGPCFIKTYWGKDGDSYNGVGLIDEDKLPKGNNDHAPGDDKGGVHADGKVIFDFGVDRPGHLAIQALNIQDDKGNTIVDLSVDKDGNLVGANDLHTADGQPIVIDRSAPDGDGVVVWTAFVDLGGGAHGDAVFTFSLDTAGSNIGEFDFCLLQALAHPFTDDPSDDTDTNTEWEDNLHVDITVRGYDVDGDWADGHVTISIDDDSPDPCKIKIVFDNGEGDNKLVHDETHNVQNNGNTPGDPDASGEDEDDVAGPLPGFESKFGATAIGYAETILKVDLSGGTADANAAIGADRPGTVGAITIVTSGGGAFNGEATNLKDTATGQQIFLYSDGDFVVGRVGGALGEVAFALHIDGSHLDMAQYRAIEHPNHGPGDRDDSVSLLAGNNEDSVVFLQVTVTDADGDAVTIKQAVGGNEGNPSIVFQDDGPVVSCGTGTLSLEMDETISLSLKDYDDPNYPNDGVHDGSTIEGDALLHQINPGPGLPNFPIGWASGNVSGLFSVNFGTDGPGDVSYALTILNSTTTLKDTRTGEFIELIDDGGVIKGQTVTTHLLVFAVTLDPNTGEIIAANYRAVDHGNEEPFPGAQDEVAFLTAGTLGVTATAHDHDQDSDSKTIDISHSIAFEDDAPKFSLVNWGLDHDATQIINGIGLIDEDALPHGKSGGPGDDAGGTSTDGQILFDFGTDGPGFLTIDSLKVTNSLGNSIDLADLHTADGQPLVIDKSAPDVNGVVSWTAYVDLGGGKHGDKVFEFDIDTKGSDIGEFEFTLFKPLEHPFTDPDSLNNGPEIAFEDNLNFDFTIIGTDGDGDSDTGHIRIQIDDDSPVAVNDTDSVTEGVGNIATGNVVTGIDGSFFGPDANGTDGNKDFPGADEPYTISKLSHDGHNYTLSADGLTVLKDGAPLVGPEGFDGKVLTITTHEGATFQIVLISSTLSEVGSYKYTAGEPPHHDMNTLAGPADTAASRSAAFDTLGEWQSSFAAAGITVSGINGSVVIKDINVAGPDDYRGLGVSNGPGDEPEVDLAGPDEAMRLDFAAATNNAKLTLGALFDGHQFDAGNQEIVLWQAFNGAVLVASGQILGSDNGLVTLDIDTGGSLFNKIVLTPLDNGAGSNSANNSDFLLLNVETCKQADVKESFTYTLQDADGDRSTATLTINVEDTQPTIPVQTSGGLSILVDEDGLNPPGTIKDGIGDHNINDAEEDHTGPNAAVDDAKHIGTIPFVAGADPVTIELSVDNNGDTGLLTLTGKHILAAWDPEEQRLVGYVEGTNPIDPANQIFVMQITGQVVGAFNYTFTLLQPIKHADGGQDDNTENDPDPYFNIGIQIEDKDCDVAYTTLKVTIDDDMPVVKISADSRGTVTHDESAGLQNNDQPGSPPSLFNVLGAGTAIGWAHTNHSAVDLSGARYGADGPGSTTYALHIPADGTNSGVETTDGHHIWLYQGPNGIIIGREGDATLVPNPAGTIIFAIAIDSNGELTVVQYDSLKHPDHPNNYDEDIGLDPAALQVVTTLTDADGDSASGSANIGGLVRFDDDGPKAKIEATSANVQHDETAGVQNPGDGDMDQAGALPANLVAVGTLIGWAKSNSAVVTTAGSSFGADEEGATSVLSLKVSSTGVNSGLDITSGESIFLYKEGDVVVGRVGSGIGGNTPNPAGSVAFVVSIDTDGKLNVAQYLSIHHDNTGSFDETASISSSALQVVVTVTDGDGDVATDSVNIGNHVRFDDDGPTANPDFDSVTEDAAENYASGNVVTGVDGGLATDSNGTDGVPDSGGADGIKAHSVQWADSAEIGGLDKDNSIAGKYGTLFVDDNGNYKYVLDNGNTDVNKLNDGDKLQEIFTYYVKDGDDDKTSSTLTITIDGHTDAQGPTARDAVAHVDEDGIPVIGNHDSAPGDDNADAAPDQATPDEHIFKDNLVVAWNGNVGTITLSDGDWSQLRTITGHTIVQVGDGTGLLQGYDSTEVTAGVPNLGATPIFQVEILDASSGLYQVTLFKPIFHPDTNNDHSDDATDFGKGGFEDNVTIPIDVTYTNIGGSVTKSLSIDVDDDMPFVAPTTCGTISLAVDETLGGGADVLPNPGFTAENDETLFALPAQLTSIGARIGAAQDNAANLFNFSAGADGEFDHSYELNVTNGGATGLTDTATGLAINLVKVGDVVQGQVGVGPLVAFAFYIDEATGLVSMAQYRAIVHTDPSNPDEVRFMNGNQGVLAVTLTVIDNDGDKASLSRDISGAVSFDDDGPHSAVIAFVAGKDTLDDEGSPLPGYTGIEGAGTGVDVVGAPSSVTFDVNVDAGTDGLGSITYNLAQIISQNSGLRAIDKTADGATITFSIEGGSGDVIGKIDDAGAGALNGTIVLRVHALDADTFQVTETSPLFHTGQGEDPDLNFKVVLNVTDKDGDSIQATAVVKIDDDMPNATPDSGTAQATPRMNTNLLLILDDSGSMTESTSLTNTNKLQALLGAVNELLEQYGNLGTVKVCLIRFDSTASTKTSGGNVWLTLDQAKALLTTLVADNNTNYDAALLEAMKSYQTNTLTDHKLTAADVTGPIQNVGYFISDGIPNDNNNWASDPYKVPGWVAPATGPGVGATDGVAGINTEEEYLQYFLNQEDIKMYAVGIGNGINAAAATELKHVSYDGTGAGKDDDANLYIELKDLAQLSQTLVGTVVVPIGGNIGNFGADGGYVSQITLAGGTTVNFNYFTNSISSVIGSGVTSAAYNGVSGELTITLTNGSALVLNVKTGAWTYTPAAGDTATHDFGFTLKDFDGDTDSSTLSVSATQSGFKPIGRDDQVISNVDGVAATIVVPTAAFLWNDEDKDGDPLTFNSTLTNISDLDAATAVVAGNVSIKDNNDQDGGSFTYKVESADGSDTANVTVNRDQHGNNTLNGNGLDNIMVGRDGVADTINGYQGNDVLIGGSGDDILNGGDGRDWLIGGDGNDILNGGAGNDLIEGGAGTKDLIDFSEVGGGFTFTLGAGGSGTADVNGHDTYSGIEGVIGGSGADKITGNSGDNYLDGGAGNDTLIGGGGTDTLFGNSGNDTLVYGNATSNYDGGTNTSNTLSATNAGDILDISGVASLDLTSIANSHFTNLETISMNGGGNQTLTLNASDVIDFGTGSFTGVVSGMGASNDFATRDAIRIDGDVGDVVNLSSGTGEWIDITATINNEPTGYRVFAFDPVVGGGAGLTSITSYAIVDNDITVNVVA